MSKKDPLDPKAVKTTAFEISEDELEARMKKQEELHNEPVQKAVAILEAALCTVLTKLGVDCNLEDDVVKAQQEFLGITIWEHTDERSPQLNGFFVHVGHENYTPFAWVGAARINHLGQCFCDIQWLQEDRMTETGGIKLVQ